MSAERSMPYTDAEMDAAMVHLLERLEQLSDRTGYAVGEFIEADLFGLHAMAYVIALREPAPVETVHARATARYVELLSRGPGYDEIADRLLTESYGCSRAVRPRRPLHSVKD